MLATHNWNTGNGGAIELNVEDIIMHPDFDIIVSLVTVYINISIC